MRISNDNYINNTNERMLQLKNNEKISKKSVKSQNSETKIDSIKAGIRENNVSMRNIQTQITQNQVAIEHLNALKEKLNEFKSGDFSEQELTKINTVIENAIKNANFNKENVFEQINFKPENVSNGKDFDKLIKQIQINVAKMETSSENNRVELAKVALKQENKLAVLSTDNSKIAKENVKSVIENIGQIFNAQSNIMNEQVKTLINR